MAAIEESLSDLIQGYLSIWARDPPLSGYLLNSPLLFSTSRATCHLLSAPGTICMDLINELTCTWLLVWSSQWGTLVGNQTVGLGYLFNQPLLWYHLRLILFF